ncbi:MAG: hypothetical protein EXR75_15640 [Myxococcales bacterium]|nr:hypothetical protein [Myxococcales bacterium]
MLVLAGGAIGCSEAESTAPIAVVAQPLCPTLERTCKEVKALAWAEGITVECGPDDELFLVKSTGIPDYKMATPKLAAQDWEFLVPLSPSCATETAPRGAVSVPDGMMLNGIPFYPAIDPTTGNDLVTTAKNPDDCAGNIGPGCAYQFRSVSSCIFGKDEPLADHADADGHAALIGLGLDGFAIYAPDTLAGEPALDSCNGHYTEARGYHYHGSETAPYLMGCMVGAERGDIRFTARLTDECLKFPKAPSGSGMP